MQAVAARGDPAAVDVNTDLGVGRGMIVSPSGEVLTNNHVMEDASTIQVSVQGHVSPHRATVIGEDPSADVVLLKVQGLSHLPTATNGMHQIESGRASGSVIIGLLGYLRWRWRC